MCWSLVKFRINDNPSPCSLSTQVHVGGIYGCEITHSPATVNDSGSTFLTQKNAPWSTLGKLLFPKPNASGMLGDSLTFHQHVRGDQPAVWSLCLEYQMSPDLDLPVRCLEKAPKILSQMGDLGGDVHPMRSQSVKKSPKKTNPSQSIAPDTQKWVQNVRRKSVTYPDPSLPNTS